MDWTDKYKNRTNENNAPVENNNWTNSYKDRQVTEKYAADTTKMNPYGDNAQHIPMPLQALAGFTSSAENALSSGILGFPGMVMDIAGNIIAPNKEDTGVLATVRRAAAYPLQNNPLRAADQFVQNKAVTPFQQAFVPESKPYDPNVEILENAKNILTPVNIASGIGSMIGFLAPGGLVEGGVRTGAETLAKKAASSKLLAGAATKVANMSKKGLIAAIGGITEGSTEAVNVYDDILNNGGDEGQAALAAAKTFAWNVPIDVVTNTLGMGMEHEATQNLIGSALKRVSGGKIADAAIDKIVKIIAQGSSGLLSETGQETAQSVVSQKYTDNQTWGQALSPENVKEIFVTQGIPGGVVGAMTGGAFGAMNNRTPGPIEQRQINEQLKKNGKEAAPTVKPNETDQFIDEVIAPVNAANAIKTEAGGVVNQQPEAAPVKVAEAPMAAPDAQIMTQEQAAQQQAAEIGQGNNANTATGPLDILGATQTQSAALSGEQQPSQNNIWQAAATQVQNNPYLLGGYPQVNPNIVRMAGQQNQGPLDVLGVTQPQATAMPTEQQLAPVAEQQAPVTPQPQMVQAPETAQATETAPKNQHMVKWAENGGRIDKTPVVDKIVPLESLVTSNNDNGGINPNYPQEYQPRDRSRFADMIQVDNIAKNLDPEMLGATEEIGGGSPIVDKNGNVISGNGRTMAIRKAYGNPELAETSGKKYTKFIQSYAKKNGIDISGIKNPVLVRELQNESANEPVASWANVPTVAGMSASEQARVDAKKLTPEILSTYTDGDLDGINGSSQFIRSFQDKAVAKSQMADFMDKDGKVSQNGLRRIKAALVAKAYGDSSVLGRMSESTDDNMKNITNALTLAAPHMAFVQNKMDNGTLDEKYSIQKPLYEAVSELEDLRKNNGNVADVLNQSNLFGPQMSDAAKTLLQFMDANKRKPNNIRQLLNDYATAVEEKGDPKQKNMFETEPETVNGLLNRMIKKQGLTVSGESVGEKQQGKLDFYEDEKKPEAKAPEKQEEKPADTSAHNYPQTELDGYEPKGANAVDKYLDMVHHLVALRKKGTPLSNANDLTKAVASLYENAIKEAKDKHLGISESIRDISTLLARLANQHVNEDMYGDAESGIRKEVEYIDGVLESKQPKKEESKKSGGKMTTETEYRSEDNGDGTFNVVKVVTTKTAEGNIVATQTRSVEDGENLTEDEADTLKSELEAQNSATAPETKAGKKSSVVSETAKNEQEGNTARGTEAVKPKGEVTQNDTLDNSPADNIIRQKDLTLDKFAKSDWKQLPTPQLRLAKMVFDELSKGSQIQNNVKFARMADEAWGGTQGQGAYEMANAYDAMELGVNMYIRDKGLNPSGINSKENLLKMMDDIKTTILDKLPTMNSRSDDKIKYQQFSTPPNYSALANWLLASGKSDMVLEPSAGIGGLAVFAKNSGADVVVNELAKNRIDTLKAMGFDRVFTENAEQINNILPNDVQPSRVVMNPPFSSSGDRGTANKTKNAEAHITQALLRLKDGGRAVIILGKGMADDAPAFKKFWDGIKQDYNVRANVELSGKDYAKYGTTFGNVMVVVDKTGATPKTADGKWATVTGKYDSIADAINKIYPTLEAIHNDGRNLASAETSGAGRQNLSGRDQQQGGRKSQENNGAAQNSVQLDGQSANESNGGKSGGTAGGNIGTQTGGREAVRQSESNRPAGERTSSTAKRGNGESGTAGGVSVGHAGREGISSGERPEGVSGNGGSDTGEHAVRTASDSAGEPERSVQSDRPGDGGEGSVKLKSKEEIIKEQQKARPAEKDDNATFTHYVSPVAGPEHPADLDEPDAMASVKAPSIAVKLKLDNKILTDGSLSAPQQEIIARAIQSFDKKINEGIPDAEARQGFFIGDGTGVGKGREISGIIMDQLNRGVGNGKAIWISKDHDLVNDARRDWMGLGGKESDIISQEAETTNGKQLDNNSKGVLFTAYSYFSRDPQTIKKGRDRIKEIQDWLGKDFDGVIALDEAHTVNNVLDKKTARGSKKGARSATAIQDLLDAFPNARVVYATATGETEVENLAMLSRLPLWGMRTAFKTMDDFMAKMKSGGTSAMELVARDMKAMGVYLARSLSFRSGKYSDENVTYSRLEHTLNDNQRAIYNEVATGYQVVLENVHKAMLMTGATKWNGSQFYGSMQRCFNQILTSMSIPSVIQSIENDLKEGHSAVIQITNTNEAELKRAAAKLREGDTVDDLDLTPKDTLIDYVRDYFPIQVWEDYIDDNGNHAKRPAVDSEGKPVIDQQAVRMRDALIDRLDSIRFPDSPLDTIIKHFGIANVAEITGRTVRPNYEHKSDKILIPISDKARQAEAKAFQNGDKKILIFSEAGGTGFSYHADKTKKNQQKRIHYLLQPGWKAAAAIQGLGRTNRSNQAHKPHVVLVTTDVPGQKRFISTIARRLEQLGALTQGDRGAQNNGIFNERDNIESQQAQKALDSLIANLDSDTLKRMGLDGDVKANKQIPISKFLNRLLAMNLEEQSDIFQEFNDNLDHEIKVATDNGTLDTGTKNLRADSIIEKNNEVVYKDGGIETRYVELDTANRQEPRRFTQRDETGFIGFYLQKQANDGKGRVVQVYSKNTVTDPRTGKVLKNYSTLGVDPAFRDTVLESKLNNTDTYEKLDETTAKKLWSQETNTLPNMKHITRHIITGAILPIYNQLELDNGGTVYNIRLDDGTSMLGLNIPAKKISRVLSNLASFSGRSHKVDSDAIIRDVLDNGSRYTFANGWQLKRASVHGEFRAELVGPDFTAERAVDGFGVLKERIEGRQRFFVPANRSMTLDMLRKYSPLKTDNNSAYRIVDAQKAEAVKNITAAGLRASVRGAQVFDRGNGKFILEFKNGNKWVIDTQAESIPINPAIVKRDYGRDVNANDLAVGRTRVINGKTFIDLVAGLSGPKTYGHELFEAAWRQMTKAEREACIKDYGSKENSAERFGDLLNDRLGKLTKRTTAIFQRIRDFFANIRAKLFGPKSEDVFRAIESGAIMNRDTEQTGNEESYRLADKAPQTPQEAAERLSQEQKDAKAEATTKAPKVVQDAIKGLQLEGMVAPPTGKKRSLTIKERWHKFYSNQIDELHPLFQTFGRDFYEKASNALYGIGSKAQFRILYGDDTKTGAKGLKQIYDMIPAEQHSGFSYYALLKHLRDVSKMSYDAADRIEEIKKELDNTFDEEHATSLKLEMAGLARLQKIVKARPEVYDEALRKIEEKFPNWKAPQQELVKYNRSLLNLISDTGIISKKLHDELLKRYPNYVPLQRDFGEESGLDNFVRTRGLVNVANPLKTLRGSERDVIDPLDQIIRNTFAFESVAARQQVARDIVDRYDAGDLEGIIEETDNVHHGKDESVFYVYEDGKKRLFRTDKDIYNALVMSAGGAKNDKDNLYLKIAKAPAAALRAGTTHSITFGIGNIFRDTFAYGVVGKEFRPIIDTVNGFLALATDEALVKDFMKNGGVQEMSWLSNDKRNELISMLKERKTWKDNAVVKYNPISLYWKLSGAFAEMSEQASRLGQYKRLLEKGYDKEKAIFETRDNMNFMRAGVYGKTINQFVSFYNASIQGVDKLCRTLYHDGKFDRKALMRGLMYLTAASMAVSFYNYGDDDRKKKYLNLAPWRKNMFWNFIIGDEVFSIPKPFEAGMIFASLPERFMDYLYQKDKRAFDRVGESFMSSLTPDFAPTILTTYLELAHNYSGFYGRQIVPDSEKDLDADLQYGPYQAEWAKDVTKITKYFPEFAGIPFLDTMSKTMRSPRMLEYAVLNMGGAGAKDYSDIYNRLSRGFKGETRPAEDMINTLPGIRKLFADAKYGGRDQEAFRKEVENLSGKLKSAEERYDRGQVADLTPKDIRTLQLSANIKYVNSFISNQKEGINAALKAERQIMTAQGMSAQQKKEQIDRLNAYILAVSREGLDRIDEIQKYINTDRKEGEQ